MDEVELCVGRPAADTVPALAGNVAETTPPTKILTILKSEPDVWRIACPLPMVHSTFITGVAMRPCRHRRTQIVINVAKVWVLIHSDLVEGSLANILGIRIERGETYGAIDDALRHHVKTEAGRRRYCNVSVALNDERGID